MADEAELRGAEKMRDFIGSMIHHYAEGCEANEDREAGRIAASVATSIGRLVEMVPPGAPLVTDKAGGHQ